MTKKKKSRQSKHQPEPGKEEDTSDEDCPSNRPGNGCPHTARAINVSNLKKALKSNTIKPRVCQSCNTNEQNKTPSPIPSADKTGDPIEGPVDEEIWLCLQCGHQGCGRNSTFKHSLLHHQIPHSDPHDLVVSTDSWATWCYKCDDEVGNDSARRLAECVEILKKTFDQLDSKTSQSSSTRGNQVHKVNPETVTAAKEVSKNVESTPKPTSKKPINGLRPDTQTEMRVKGLSNLGNTCFFNAVLQSLSQCTCFVGVFREHCASGQKWHIDLLPEQRVKDKESLDVVLSACGPVTEALMRFLDEMDQTSQKKNGVVNPAQLFKRVCEKASQFRGFQQQDSHELLRYLLDAVKSEEVKRQRLALLHSLGIEKTTHKEVDEKTRGALKALSPVTDFTVIEKVFGGQLVSTVQCEDCHVSSQVFESFMDLCLPIFEEKPSRPGIHKRASSLEKEESSHEGIIYRKVESTKTSRHQEKKLKRQQKRDVKKQVKMQKHLATVVPLEEGTIQDSTVSSDALVEESKIIEETEAQEMEENQVVSEGYSGDSVDSLFPDMEVYITEADVEDNDETSSHHSHGSVRSQNESDLSSLSPSETVCASGSTTVESDLTTTETLDDSAAQSIEIGYLCNQVASLDLHHKSQSKESCVVDSSTTATASALTSPSSVEITSTDSGIVGSSADSGVFHAQGKSVQRSIAQKCNKKLLATSLMPLAPPCKLASQECSVLSSLHQFTMRELLMGNNKFGCESCTRRKAERSGVKNDEKPSMVYTNASKQLLISSPPAVLTLQLKRFQQVGRNLMKVNRYVEFPVLLDLAPFCSRLALALPHVHSGQHQIVYSLSGVVEHSGKLSGGHYTAFVKVQPTQQTATNLPFLNHKFMGEKELQFLLEEVDRKHDSDYSWEMYSDSGENAHLLFEEEKVRNVPPGKWFHVSDSHVTEVNESTVLRCKAYLLFYERIV